MLRACRSVLRTVVRMRAVWSFSPIPFCRVTKSPVILKMLANMAIMIMVKASVTITSIRVKAERGL